MTAGQMGLFAVPSRPAPALTIKSPWAQLVTQGVKDVENRGWYTSYRGPLYIHAGKGIDKDAMAAHGHLLSGEYPSGAIIGLVDVIDCVQDSDSEWAEAGSWHWILANARALPEPVPAKGQLGLWTLDDETARLAGEIR
jgi:hypothetical protein